MSPAIRVGLIGLGQGNGDLVPGLWGAKAHLPYLLASPKYEVIAVANSSVKSAQGAIDYHKLGPKIKAYGSSEDLSKDPDVDLVVVSVRVAKHYVLTKPALLAGKDVFVEWPLGANTEEAKELTNLATSKGAKTIVGLQARASPLVVKVKEIVGSGQIGTILSSTVVGSFAGLPYDFWPAGAEYYLDKESGGNNFTIYFGHFLDSFTHILGPFSHLKSTLKTAFPSTKIVAPTGEIIDTNYPRTSHDHVLVQGTLSSGAVASLIFRTVAGKTIDSSGIRWLITGTDGEIEVNTTEAQWQMGPPGTVLKARIGKDSDVQAIDLKVKEEPEIAERPFPGTNTARLYEAFGIGDREKFPTFEDALETHRLLDWIREEAK